MGEFQLIEWIRRRAGQDGSGVVLGIGDDAAVLEMNPERDLVVCTDTLNAGVHFSADTPPRYVGHKSLAVNLSDLAAMGATPRWALLSISMPADDEAWLQAFIDGFLALASSHAVALVGGDTCCGRLSITVTALGQADPGSVLTRSGAKTGDLVVVSGNLGDASLALCRVLEGSKPCTAGLAALREPLPRIALGASLVGKATSCIDISDGLLADLNHVVEASGCGAVIELSRLPSSPELLQCEQQFRWNLQLAGGDDYELCFTLPGRLKGELPGMSHDLDIDLTVIGEIVAEPGVRCIRPDGGVFAPGQAGFEHFK